MKLRHLFFNRPKMAQAEKDKLDEMADELLQLRLKR